jgi:hypothetical protein
MTLGVQERARRIGTFRFLEVRLMETVAAWTPTTPEMEAKVMFGRHIWDFAQHADALGKRMFELRQPPQHSLPPSVEYAALLDEVLAIDGTAGRLDAFYDVLLPGAQRRYEAYQGEVDAVVDAPSLVIVERILGDLRRQRADAAALRRELGLSAPAAHPLAAREGALPLLGAPPA